MVGIKQNQKQKQKYIFMPLKRLITKIKIHFPAFKVLKLCITISIVSMCVKTLELCVLFFSEMFLKDLMGEGAYLMGGLSEGNYNC